MTLKTIATGSSGNCHALINENEILLLDLGVSAKEIKRGIDYRISDVVGAVVTHWHLDHSKSVKDFEDMGTQIWKPYSESNLTDRMNFGKFFIQCFPLSHNGVANFGFYIKVDDQKILYLTDFEYCKFTFQSLEVQHILIEANYISELVNRDIPNYEHKLRGHCSLQTCCNFIKANKTNTLRNVILCHLSNKNSDSDKMVAEVQKVAGNANVNVAEVGKEFALSLYPF